MKIESKWLRVTALTLSFPTIIFSLAYFSWYLVEEEILSQKVSFSLFFVLIFFILLGILVSAVKNKKKN